MRAPSFCVEMRGDDMRHPALRGLHVALLQHGADQVQVGGRHVDVHVDVDGHQLSAVGAPEVHLQGAP